MRKKIVIEKKHIFDCTIEELDALTLGKATISVDRKEFLDFGCVWKSSRKEIMKRFYENKKMSKEELQSSYNSWVLSLYKKAVVYTFQKQISNAKSDLERSVFAKEIKMIRESRSIADLDNILCTFPHYNNFLISDFLRIMKEKFCFSSTYLVRSGKMLDMPVTDGLNFISVCDYATFNGHTIVNNSLPHIDHNSSVPFVVAGVRPYSYSRLHLEGPAYSTYLSKEETIFLLTVACSYTFPENVFKAERVTDIVWDKQQEWICANDLSPDRKKIYVCKYPGLVSDYMPGDLLEFPLFWNEYCEKIYSTYINKENRKSDIASARKKEFQDFLNS